MQQQERRTSNAVAPQGVDEALSEVYRALDLSEATIGSVSAKAIEKDIARIREHADRAGPGLAREVLGEIADNYGILRYSLDQALPGQKARGEELIELQRKVREERFRRRAGDQELSDTELQILEAFDERVAWLESQLEEQMEGAARRGESQAATLELPLSVLHFDKKRINKSVVCYSVINIVPLWGNIMWAVERIARRPDAYFRLPVLKSVRHEGLQRLLTQAEQLGLAPDLEVIKVGQSGNVIFRFPKVSS